MLTTCSEKKKILQTYLVVREFSICLVQLLELKKKKKDEKLVSENMLNLLLLFL